jgi:type VI secretion system secreted protein VgrG
MTDLTSPPSFGSGDLAALFGDVIQDGRLLTIDSPLGPDMLLLERLVGEEALSEPFRFELTVRAKRDDIASAELVGHKVSFTLERADGSRRPWSGHVERVVAGAAIAKGQRYYHLEVRPWLWQLTHKTDCRIFQDKSTLDILEEIFGEFGFRDYDFSGVLNTPPKRDYCVQYRESSFAFVSRLLEEDGIFYYFAHTEDGAHVLTLADGAHAYVPVPEQELRYAATDVDLNNVTRWRHAWRFVPGRWAGSDYNFEMPGTDLASEAASVTPLETNRAFEIYDWHARFQTRDAGARVSRRRMQAMETGHDTVQAASTARDLAPALSFTIFGHPAADEAGRGYAVVRIRHHAIDTTYDTGPDRRPPTYENSFTALPVEVGFVPARTTPQPRIDGIQTATVVGPAGEEIHTDRYGRIKVQFPWDRYATGDDRSSCWLRVMQPWGGRNMGAQTIPRIGMEVMVSFVEGDPDRPLAIGIVPNAGTMPPLTLPATKTRTAFKSASSPGGGGFNEMTFEDLAGAEELMMRAQRDQTELVGRNRMVNTANVSTQDTGTLWGSRVGDSEIVMTRASILIQHKQSRIILDGERVRIEFTNGHFIDLSAEGVIISSTAKIVTVRDESNFTAVDGEGVVAKGKVVHTVDAGESNDVTVSADGVAVNGKVVLLNCE